MPAPPHHEEWSAVETRETQALTARKFNVEKGTAGLAISGGGIRSATFALGVLESLKARGLLDKFHYLSTVSGGGYIGSWLSAGTLRHDNWLTSFNWRESIGHLRRYSNYLSPRVGFFSADTWSMVTIWLRNTLLIQATLILAIAGVLVLPLPLVEAFTRWPSAGEWRWFTVGLFVFGIVGIAGNQLRMAFGVGVWWLKGKYWPAALVVAAVLVAAAWGLMEAWNFHPFAAGTTFDPFDAESGAVNYRHSLPIAVLLVLAGFALQPLAVKVASFFMSDKPEEVNYTQSWVQFAVIVPLMITAFLVTSVLWAQATGNPAVRSLAGFTTYGNLLTTGWRYWPFHLSVVFASFWLLSLCSVDWWRHPGRIVAAILAPLAAVPALHALLCAIVLLMQYLKTLPGGEWQVFVWGPALVTMSFVLSIVVLIGMLGRASNDDVREWWSRLGAWLGIYATAWMVVAVCAIYGPYWVAWAIDQAPTWGAATAAGGWVGTVVSGLLAGNSPSTGTESKSTSARAKEVAAAVAPFVFIAGLLVAVSYVIGQVIVLNGSGLNWWDRTTLRTETRQDTIIGLFILGACTAGTALLAWRVDINQFSLNAFYRNRLARCYLGATRPPAARTPQNFTGFDDDDDVPLAKLADATTGPLHIVNCALNLGGSTDLALHTRHSAIFTLTPLACGTWYRSHDQQGGVKELGYVDTKFFGPDGGPTLGQAVSVSGAAASPNMGYHTSPVTAFLMTLFNVRLGWWFPNPTTGGTYPVFSLTYLLAELFGNANDKSTFVNVSDGGHFENLAAYELIRRQCKLIVISDAECDADYSFGGLGTLIRVCEVDFESTITIDVEQLRPVGDPRWSTRRWAVGDIAYKDGTHGTLVYLKASMVGTEDTSILQYKSSHPGFPHESTGDQFYGEDQFESYRHLGRAIAAEAFGGIPAGSDPIAAIAALRQ